MRENNHKTENRNPVVALSDMFLGYTPRAHIEDNLSLLHTILDRDMCLGYRPRAHIEDNLSLLHTILDRDMSGIQAPGPHRGQSVLTTYNFRQRHVWDTGPGPHRGQSVLTRPYNFRKRHLSTEKLMFF